jgi:hypothetical protein
MRTILWRLYFKIRNWIWLYIPFRGVRIVKTPQIIITVHNFDTAELRDRLNIDGFQYFPILYDDDYILTILAEEDRIQNKEEK